MTQEQRILRVLTSVPGIACYGTLERVLARVPRRDTRESLRTAVAKARKLLPPGESIENHRGIGYELVRDEARAA